MSNSVGNGSQNFQQVQPGVQSTQQEVPKQQDFNYQLHKFTSTMQKFAAEENVDKVSIFTNKNSEETKSTKNRSAGDNLKDVKEKNIFESLLSFEDPTDGADVELINETFDLDIDAKGFSDVWDSIEVISENLFKEKEKVFKEFNDTLQAFNEPPVSYEPHQVVVNAFDETQYRQEFVA